MGFAVPTSKAVAYLRGTPLSSAWTRRCDLLLLNVGWSAAQHASIWTTGSLHICLKHSR